jgi:hypothetical protein
MLDSYYAAGFYIQEMDPGVEKEIAHTSTGQEVRPMVSSMFVCLALHCPQRQVEVRAQVY